MVKILINVLVLNIFCKEQLWLQIGYVKVCIILLSEPVNIFCCCYIDAHSQLNCGFLSCSSMLLLHIPWPCICLFVCPSIHHKNGVCQNS